ncbi:MAG: HEAT repeat domain-containing protein [Anaerolineae bacterium]
MTKAKEFTTVLETLLNSTDLFDAGTVYGLSGLDRAQIDRLREVWPQIAVERRRTLIQHLNDVSEANFEMDFQSINHMALSDPDSEVRRYAIEGLWEDESVPYMYRLVEIIRSDPSQDVRAAAIIELGRFVLLGEYGNISASDARLAQDTVLHVLHSNEDNDLRRRALEAIANCGRAGTHDLIREFYAHDDLAMRMSALFAMGRTCDDIWAAEIIEELNGTIPEMQYEAARAAGHIQLEEALPHLIRLIDQTDDTEVLEMAIWALGEIGGDRARDVLMRIIEQAEADGDEEILAAAEEALDAASLAGGDLLMFDFEP